MQYNKDEEVYIYIYIYIYISYELNEQVKLESWLMRFLFDL